MKTVRDLLDTKGDGIYAVRPEDTVYDAIKLMAEKGIGAVLVCDLGELVGILSERDYARRVILQGKSSKETPVREIMTPKVVCVSPERSIEECMAVMSDKHIRHLPVTEHGEIVGVISIGDVVKAVISEKQFIIEQLESYISQ